MCVDTVRVNIHNYEESWNKDIALHVHKTRRTIFIAQYRWLLECAISVCVTILANQLSRQPPQPLCTVILVKRKVNLSKSQKMYGQFLNELERLSAMDDILLEYTNP